MREFGWPTAPDGPPVLVIDDDPAARQLLERALTRGGWGVVSAADGPTGIGICRELQPIAVTLDVLMPGMDGWQVLGALKEDPLTAQIPVILVSMVEDRKLGFTLGASDYLVKPVSKDVLLAAIEPYRKSRGRVLVVEDDDAFRLLLVRTLERAGWSVEHVCNGAEGVLALETTAPDVVIVDLMMPVMDGFELLATMRSDLRWEAIPAVVVTARELSVDERARLNLHASEVLRKAATDCDRLLTRVIQAVATVAKGVSCDTAPSRLASQATRGR